MTPLGVALGAWLTATTVSACLCPYPGFEKGLTEADAIFVGRVVAMNYWQETTDGCERRPSRKFRYGGDPSLPNFGWGSYLTVTFEVEQAWKGVEDEFVVVYNWLGSCIAELDMGRRYLLFASETRDGTAFSINLCKRSAPLKPYQQERQHAASDLEQLGPPVFDPVTEMERAKEEHRRRCQGAPEGQAP